MPENAGQAVITVNRVDGARGIVTVNYMTAAINATPGVDFTPVSGTLVFASGVTSQTITVPVFANRYGDHDELVSVVLSNVQTTETLGNAILGSPSTAILTIQDIDPYSPLSVTAVQWAGTVAEHSSDRCDFHQAALQLECDQSGVLQPGERRPGR